MAPADQKKAFVTYTKAKALKKAFDLLVRNTKAERKIRGCLKSVDSVRLSRVEVWRQPLLN